MESKKSGCFKTRLAFVSISLYFVPHKFKERKKGFYQTITNWKNCLLFPHLHLIYPSCFKTCIQPLSFSLSHARTHTHTHTHPNNRYPSLSLVAFYKIVEFGVFISIQQPFKLVFIRSQLISFKRQSIAS